MTKVCGRAVGVSVFLAGLLLPALPARADDWPMFGRDKTRNAVSREKNPPTDWHLKGAPKTFQDGKVAEKHSENLNIKWSAALGTNTVGSPVVANGLVWIGTNNEHPRDPAAKGDASVLMCLRASDGRFLY